MIYPELRITLVPLTKLWIKKANGLENIPKKEGFIVAANHSSYMDHMIIGSTIISYLDKKMHWLAKKEHFETFFQRLWHVYIGAIPLDRQSGGKEALRFAVNALRQKKIIVIYPEGTRTLTGKIQEARTGVARLALLSKSPVIPIGLIGTFQILPKGNYVPKFKRATINIGKPMYFDKYYKRPITKRLLREVTTEIMKEIARLSSQKYEFD
ncbi:MAG TPA: lysophospholipid acyltransferase family protein [Candidatus Nanoarchaeia archaeon]|nr:lysophospholipid acyltransferase family protein [Candidatus Nanoarchaeia archaeon]